MIRRPPRSTPLYSSAASDVYKRQSTIVASWGRSSVGWNAGLSRRRSRVRVPSLPFGRSPGVSCSWGSFSFPGHLLLSVPPQARRLVCQGHVTQGPFSIANQGHGLAALLPQADGRLCFRLHRDSLLPEETAVPHEVCGSIQPGSGPQTGEGLEIPGPGAISSEWADSGFSGGPADGCGQRVFRIVLHGGCDSKDLIFGCAVEGEDLRDLGHT